MESVWSQAAAWVEAIGAIAAVIGSGWVAAGESRASRRREERAMEEAQRREDRLLLAFETAALNLAILAATQIHDLHVLLRDEAWRGRVTRVSPSRTLLATERMLRRFRFSRWPTPPRWSSFRVFPQRWLRRLKSMPTSKRSSGPQRKPSEAQFLSNTPNRWKGWT